jgi:hypothetical protein
MLKQVVYVIATVLKGVYLDLNMFYFVINKHWQIKIVGTEMKH